jgi:hypothetical protein
MRQQLRIILIMLTVCASAHAGRLSTAFSDIQLQAVAPGRPTEVPGPTGAGLVLRNDGDLPMRIRVEPLIPTAEQLKGAALAIPDLSWVRIEPEELMIPAHREGSFRVILTIPKKAAFRNKNFQVMIWSRSIPLIASAASVNSGLLSRLRFKITKRH